MGLPLVAFGLAEVMLRVFGVTPLLSREDPLRGFSGRISAFVRQRDEVRTRQVERYAVFNDQSFLADKPDQGLRVFCLGGSSVYGFPWGATAAFPAILEESLSKAFPNRFVEVVNAGGMSYAMHRVSLLVDEILEYQPDALVIYSGHNEFIERDLYRELRHQSPVRSGLESLAARSSLYTALRDRWHEGEQEPTDRDLELFVRRETREYFPSEKEEVIADFEQQLRQLVKRAQSRDVKVILCSVPCNWKDWKPERSIGQESLLPEQQAQFERLVAVGEAELAEGRSDRALASFEQAAQLAPDHALVQFLLGRCHEAGGQWARARHAYQRACDLDAWPLRRLSAMNQGTARVAREEKALFVDVERGFQRLADHELIGWEWIEDYVHPSRKGHEEIAWMILEAVLRAGWWGEAALDRASFDALCEQRPREIAVDANQLYNQGLVLEQQGQRELARERFEAAAEFDHLGALGNLARQEVERGDLEKAESLYRRLLHQDPGHPGALTDLADLLRIRGAVEESHRLLAHAIQQDPTFSLPWTVRAKLWQAQGDLSQSRVCFQRAIELEPAALGPLLDYATFLVQSGQGQEALEWWRRAVEAAPHDLYVRHQYGEALRGTGDWKQAVEVLETVLASDPANARARRSLGQALGSLGQWNRAIAELQRCVSEQPEDLEIRLTLGIALGACERWPEAAEVFKEAARRAPESAEAHFHRGRVLEQQGDLREALASYERAVQCDPDSEIARQALAACRVRLRNP